MTVTARVSCFLQRLAYECRVFKSVPKQWTIRRTRRWGKRCELLLQVGMQTVLFDGNMVEAVLIVSGYPELYNISSSDYHNLFLKKELGEKYMSLNIIVVIAITSQKRVSRPSCSTLCFFLKPFLCVFRHKDAFWVNGTKTSFIIGTQLSYFDQIWALTLHRQQCNCNVPSSRNVARTSVKLSMWHQWFNRNEATRIPLCAKKTIIT